MASFRHCVFFPTPIGNHLTLKLEPHRQAWLDTHPDRNALWLRRMAVEGFDVHHIDGDHDNNDPDNLVLIEHADHFRLHGTGPMRRGRGKTKRGATMTEHSKTHAALKRKIARLEREACREGKPVIPLSPSQEVGMPTKFLNANVFIASMNGN